MGKKGYHEGVFWQTETKKDSKRLRNTDSINIYFQGRKQDQTDKIKGDYLVKRGEYRILIGKQAGEKQERDSTIFLLRVSHRVQSNRAHGLSVLSFGVFVDECR